MAKDYLRYTTDDFIADEYFQRWIKFPDRETDAFWKNWIIEHPEQRDDILKASGFINHLSFRIEAPDDEKIEASLNQSLQVIQEKESKWLFKLQKKSFLKKVMWVTAICAIIFVSFSLWKYVQEGQQVVEIATGNNETRKISLPDSTVIILNANSSLRYLSDINESSIREVWLKGEAFFIIHHMEEAESVNRFIVHSDDLNVEVSGTSFNVRKKEDVSNVSLNTGLIKIRLHDDKNSVIYLTPGDFFQYANKEKSLYKKRVKAELYSSWKDEKTVLNKTPLLALAAFIHDTYGYNTIIDNKMLEHANFSGTISFKNEKIFIESLSIASDMDIIKKDKDLFFKQKLKANN